MNANDVPDSSNRTTRTMSLSQSASGASVGNTVVHLSNPASAAQMPSHCAFVNRTRTVPSGVASLSRSCSAVRASTGSSDTSQPLGKLTSGATAPTAAGTTWISPLSFGFGSVAGSPVPTPVFICWTSVGVGGSSDIPNRGTSLRTFIESRPAPEPSAW